MIRRKFVYCGIGKGIEYWNCQYGYDVDCSIRFLDENNDITKKVCGDLYYFENAEMNKLIKHLNL